MYTPLILPIPILFIYLFLKILALLIAPFALGLIVRLRSQRTAKPQVKVNQSSDKSTPTPPSPSSDGEDRPEDSYWTRFKKWCSEHSLAIGLGITLVAATLIYIYREDISQALYEAKLSEEKKKDAVRLTDHACEEIFFNKKDKINGQNYVEKSKNFTIFFEQINAHYQSKTDTSEETLKAKRILKIFLEKYSELFTDSQATSEVFQKKANFVDKELAKEPKDRHFNFKRALAFLSRNQDSTVAKRMYENWYNLMLSYLLDVLDTPSRQAPDQK